MSIIKMFKNKNFTIGSNFVNKSSIVIFNINTLKNNCIQFSKLHYVFVIYPVPNMFIITKERHIDVLGCDVTSAKEKIKHCFLSSERSNRTFLNAARRLKIYIVGLSILKCSLYI